MRAQEGHTFTELMIVLVILGLFAAFTSGAFGKSMETSRRNKAAENLKVIYNMEKRYQMDNGQFFPVKDPVSALCLTGTVAEINAGLGIFIRDSDFSYSLNGICPGTITTGYNVVATRLNGLCSGKTITMSHAGGEPLIDACGGW